MSESGCSALHPLSHGSQRTDPEQILTQNDLFYNHFKAIRILTLAKLAKPLVSLCVISKEIKSYLLIQCYFEAKETQGKQESMSTVK